MHKTVPVKIFKIILPRFDVLKPLSHTCFHKLLPIKHRETLLLQ